MTRKERAQVVELLRCAADVVGAGERPECAFTTASERLGYSTFDKEPWETAWAAEWTVAHEVGLTDDGRTFLSNRIEVLLEAAQRVEEGEWP